MDDTTSGPGFGQLEELFHELSELGEAERAERLRELREQDASLAANLSDLLGASQSTDVLLDTPVTGEGGRNPGESLAAGDEVGGFRLVEIVGSGGMGTVWRARQLRPERDVALKILRSSVDGAGRLRRFELESEILATLDHPGIAQVHAAGIEERDDGPLPYIAMEWVEGEDLMTALRKAEPSARERVELLKRVADAVAHAHARGVIHRDLKPSNILLRPDGLPKVLDFGIARVNASESRDEESSLPQRLVQAEATMDGEIVGTLAYMSPEQARGENVGTQADVWALGVLLHEALTGRRPLNTDGLGLFEALDVVRSADPKPDPELKGDLAAILGRALAANPEERYRGAGSLTNDLGRYLRREPVTARPYTPGYGLRRLIHRHPFATVLASLAIVLLILGFVLTVDARRRADREALRARREAKVASEARDEIASLSDERRLDELLAASRSLVPIHPDRIPAFNEWVREAEALLERISWHEASLKRLEALRPTEASRNTEEAWRHERLEKLLERLRSFGGESGRLEVIESRLDLAGRMRAETIEAHAKAWADASRRLRGDSEFEDLEFMPQPGLIPLGRDPKSGREEFLHWLSHEGELPARQNGELELSERAGIVLVLVPGGVVLLGAQAQDPAAPRFDPDAERTETPVQRVRLAPYFIAKHETTQAQWKHCQGANPSSYPMGRRPRRPRGVPAFTGRHPVETVSWHEARTWARTVGLDLPTEAQWETALRAGNDEPWISGKEASSIFAYANLGDRAALRAGMRWPGLESVRHDDGWPVHAPVGSFRPNAFGLHDLCGNVREWCLDSYDSYANPVREEDGLRQSSRKERCLRGGDFAARPLDVRSANRHGSPPESRSHVAGFRVARALDAQESAGERAPQGK